jgi:hypothetical protein
LREFSWFPERAAVSVLDALLTHIDTIICSTGLLDPRRSRYHAAITVAR